MVVILVGPSFSISHSRNSRFTYRLSCGSKRRTDSGQRKASAEHSLSRRSPWAVARSSGPALPAAVTVPSATGVGRRCSGPGHLPTTASTGEPERPARSTRNEPLLSKPLQEHRPAHTAPPGPATLEDTVATSLKRLFSTGSARRRLQARSSASAGSGPPRFRRTRSTAAPAMAPREGAGAALSTALTRGAPGCGSGRLRRRGRNTRCPGKAHGVPGVGARGFWSCWPGALRRDERAASRARCAGSGQGMAENVLAGPLCSSFLRRGRSGPVPVPAWGLRVPPRAVCGDSGRGAAAGLRCSPYGVFRWEDLLLSWFLFCAVFSRIGT